MQARVELKFFIQPLEILQIKQIRAFGLGFLFSKFWVSKVVTW